MRRPFDSVGSAVASFVSLPPRPHLPLALLALLIACGPDSTTTDTAPHIGDSLGIRIVSYDDTPTRTAPFRLGTRPRYRHGANPGDYAFQGASVGRLLPDGSAVVYDMWNGELIAFSPDGLTHEVLAAEGDGPGDVRYVSGVFALGRDSIMVADTNLGRVTLFVGGTVARTINLPRSGGLAVRGIGSSGALLLATSSGPPRFEEEWRPGHMVRFEMATGAFDTVATFDFMPRIPPGLRWNPIRALGEVAVADGSFVQTRSDRAEVTWRLPDATVTQIVRWQAEPALLTDEALGHIETEERMELRMHNPSLSDTQILERNRRNMAAYYASVGRPMPLFGALLADDEGRVWLPSYNPGGELHSVPPYMVIAPDGKWLGLVQAPPGFRILDVSGGLVLGAEMDEMDVVTAVVYELIDEQRVTGPRRSSTGR